MTSGVLSPTIRLAAADNVVVARADMAAGTAVAAEGVTSAAVIPAGHKLAVRTIDRDAPVIKYGQIIGFASRPIHPGEHVHTHNVTLRAFDRRIVKPAATGHTPPPAQRALFDGIVRADGRVATRNYIGVLSTVNCSATAVHQIAAAFGGPALADYPNIDGVVPFSHGSGCGMAGDGEGFAILRRTITGLARHPNFHSVVLLGLGCETIEMTPLLEELQVLGGAPLLGTTLQAEGGTRAAVARAVARIREILPDADRVERVPVAAEHLVLALECGGSDAYSGISANPALGRAVDLLVAQGGTAVLAETPEIYGAEHLLAGRAANPAVADALLDRIRWWERYTAGHGGGMDNNPSPGNRAGGLTTIVEKSLGAMAKGGASDLTAVVQYAEPVTGKGLVFMDTPGYDAVSLTGMAAGGCNLACFTTGRGSAYGGRPVPCLKLASNTALFRHMRDDMDINCGEVVDGDVDLDELGRRIFETILRTASGERTRSERIGVGDHEMVPWVMGAVM